MIECGHGWELRLGDYREVLSDVVADHCITDLPYLGACDVANGAWAQSAKSKGAEPVMGHYTAATEQSLTEACAFAASHTKTWIVMFNDFPGTVVIQRELRALGATTAEPIAWVKPYACTARRGAHWLPEKGTEFISCARMRQEKANGRLLPGSYIGPENAFPSRDLVVTGGKPLLLMRSIIRDYTEPGDIVLDMHGGGGTTLLAAVIEGRRAIGAEIHEETFRKAVKRLRAGHSMSLDFG